MSGASCRSSHAGLGAGWASLGLLRVLSERSAAASSDYRFDWQKMGSGKHVSTAFPRLHSRNVSLASARCIFRYVIVSHQFEPFV